MTRRESMQRRKRRERARRRQKMREFQRNTIWIAIIAAEFIAAAIPAAILAAFVLPLAYSERGYEAVGGEWILILVTFCVAFKAIHNLVCDRIFEEEFR